MNSDVERGLGDDSMTAREELEARGQEVIHWRCQCGAENEDIAELTAMPMCGECEEVYFWEEVEDWPLTT